MPLLTDVNVYYKPSLTDKMIVLADSGTVKSCIEWDLLGDLDKERLTNLIDSVGGDAPMLEPSVIGAIVNFGSPISGSDVHAYGAGETRTVDITFGETLISVSVLSDSNADVAAVVADINSQIVGFGALTIKASSVVLASDDESLVTIENDTVFSGLLASYSNIKYVTAASADLLTLMYVTPVPGLGTTYFQLFKSVIKEIKNIPTRKEKMTTIDIYSDGTDWFLTSDNTKVTFVNGALVE